MCQAHDLYLWYGHFHSLKHEKAFKWDWIISIKAFLHTRWKLYTTIEDKLNLY